MKACWNKLALFLTKAALWSAAHPAVVKAAVDAAISKNPAPLVAAVEAEVDAKTGQ